MTPLLLLRRCPAVPFGGCNGVADAEKRGEFPIVDVAWCIFRATYPLILGEEPAAAQQAEDYSLREREIYFARVRETALTLLTN
jgi:hypothetical protein